MKLIQLVWLAVTSVFAQNSVVFRDGDSLDMNNQTGGQRTHPAPVNGTERRSAKNLIHWINSFSDPKADPYLSNLNALCLEGDLAECFKAKAISSLDEFFNKDSYVLNTNTRVVKMPETQLRQLGEESYEYVSEPKADDQEWDLFVKFLTRRVEKFLKANAIYLELDDQVTDEGRYAPKFIEEINSEVDVVEDKKSSHFSRKKLKKMIIPLLILVKLFKLKLLLFLPLILGLASFKHVLSFLALAIPGLIGFYKLCKPNLQNNYGNFGHSNFYNRPHPPYQYRTSTDTPEYLQQPLYDDQQPSYGYNSKGSPSVAFKDDSPSHNLAYNSYGEK